MRVRVRVRVRVTAALRGQGMTLNDTKEQLLIATAAGRQAWQQAEPS